MSLRFNADLHQYKLRGKALQHVTGVLRGSFGPRTYWDEWYAQRGRAMHKAVELLVAGKLDWGSVDERILPRVKAFELFLADTGVEVVKSELRLHSEKYRYAGTADLVLSAGGELVLADIKSSIEPMVDLQLAAYVMMYNEQFAHKINKACAIELKDTGKYNLRWVTDLDSAMRTFLCALTVQTWRAKHYHGG